METTEPVSATIDAEPGRDPARPATGRARLPLDVLVAYGMPTLALGFSSGLVLLYLLKFATDVLLIAPAVFASAYALARVWDAVSDPIAGYLSDRTAHHSGRRRPWIRFGAFPLAASMIMLWSPPATITGDAAMLWLSVAVFFFYTSYTTIAVPHLALGAEMTTDYHDRSRVFGSRGILDFAGVLLAGLAIWTFQTVEEPRHAARVVAWGFALVSIPLLWASVSRINENPEYRDRGGQAPIQAFRDVARNRYARLLIAVFFLENMSLAFISTLFPYITEYLLPSESRVSGGYLVFAILVALASFPIWFPLSRRFGKRNAWIASNALKVVAFGLLFFVGPDREWPGLLALVLIGSALSAHVILAPSVKADVIDYDEYLTRERKEGSYFAIWNLVSKLAGAVAVALCGFLLQFSGYQANVEQAPEALSMMRSLFSGIPGVCHVLAIALLLRFDLNLEQHAEIRLEIDRRNTRA